MFISVTRKNTILISTLSYILALVLLSSAATTSSQIHDESSSRVSKRQSEVHPALDNSISIQKTNLPATSFIVKRAKRQTKASVAKSPLATEEIIKSKRQMEFTPNLEFYYGFQPPVDSYQVTIPPFNMQFELDIPADTSTSSPSSLAPAYLPFQPQQQQQQQPQQSQDQQSPTSVSPVNINGVPMQIMCFPYQESLAIQNVNTNAPPLCCASIPLPLTCRLPVVSGMPDFIASINTALQTTKQSNKGGGGVLAQQQQYAHPYEQPLKGYELQCPDTHQRCSDDSKCVFEFQWCDSNVDCADASDETKCSCRQRIDKQRLCDGYPDCPGGEDELGCHGCPNNTFSCGSHQGSGSGDCVSTHERCDGVRQCANGKDEEGCSVLMQSYENRSEEMFPVGYSHGFLYNNMRGRWYPVCGPAFRWAKDACDAEIGNVSDVPQLEMVISPRQREIGPYLALQGKTTQMVAECPGQFVYVRCPKVHSGTRQQQEVVDDSIVGMSARNESGPMVGIIGGRASSPGSWPFVVAINKNGRFHCGGAVLSESWIISAAHCFANSNRYYYEIEAGVLRRLSYSPVQQTRRVAGAVIHQNFDRSTLRNDIALCLLDEPLVFNRWIRPARLPAYDINGVDFLDWRRMPSPGAICTVAGWGSVVEGDSRDPDHLREVDVPIVNCKHWEDRNNAEICAGFIQGGRDACQGDSGGPLMCRVPNSKDQWYLGGLVSHGVGCGRINEPGAYTKVSYFTDWIQSVIYGRTLPAAMIRTATKCPGFRCQPPYARCLPSSKRCDRSSDCLQAEDEANCPSRSLLGFLDHLFHP